MKVGFHVYLMPWFAELHLDVNGNEGWHVENRLCHLSPPQVQQSEREKGAPFLCSCPLHVSLQADNITSSTVSFSKPCVDLGIVRCCSAQGFLQKPALALRTLRTLYCAEESTFQTQLSFVAFHSPHCSTCFCALQLCCFVICVILCLIWAVKLQKSFWGFF